MYTTKMTTHFHPRPSTSAPQSPARPGSARPTIRAITPSPPQDVDATNGSRAHPKKPHGASPEMKEQSLARPRSEEIPRAHNRILKSEEIGFAHEATRDHIELKRNGAGMARRSPVRRQGRSKSHRGKPTSPTRQPSRRRIPADDQTDKAEDGSGVFKQYEPKKVQGYYNKDLSIDCPDTPTPMTLSQMRSAYRPLVSPTPIVLPKRSSNVRSSPDTVPTPANPAASQGPSPSSNASITNLKKPLANHTIQRTNPLSQHPHIHSQIILANNIDETTKSTEPQPHAKSYHLPFQSNSQPTAPQVNAINPVPAQTSPRTESRKPIPTSSTPTSSTPIQRLVSFSATSNNSGGTAQSQRSVFSTPGRDELERKKAMVEVDEGPFGRAVSVAQLNEARRVISGGDDDDMYAGKGGLKERRCGMSMDCSVM